MVSAVARSYEAGVTDEFIEPIVVVDALGAPVGSIRDGDAVIFFNFRADRARQITRALTDPGFDGFERAVFPKVYFVCLTEYDKRFGLVHVDYATQQRTLKDSAHWYGEVVRRNGLEIPAEDDFYGKR